MYETYLQFLVDELEQDRLREAAAGRLAREAKAAARADAKTGVSPIARLLRALGGRVQPTSASA